ncbi:hypothetical protein FS749_008273, partial [Ceratobasidium sp. UAMH 11750]
MKSTAADTSTTYDARERQEGDDDRAGCSEEKRQSGEDGRSAGDEPVTSPGATISAPLAESTDESDKTSDEHSHYVRIATTGPKKQVPATVSTSESVRFICPLPERSLSPPKSGNILLDSKQEVEGEQRVTPDRPASVNAPADTPSSAESSKSSPANPLDASKENLVVFPPRTFGDPNKDIVDSTTLPTPIPTGETFFSALKPTSPPAYHATNGERNVLFALDCDERSDSEDERTPAEPGAPVSKLRPTPTIVEARGQVPVVCMAERLKVLSIGMDFQPPGVDNPAHTPRVNPPADLAEEVTTKAETTVEP